MNENPGFLSVGQGRDVCGEVPPSSYDISELEKGLLLLGGQSLTPGHPPQQGLPFTTSTAYPAGLWSGLSFTWACFLYLLAHSSNQPKSPPFCLSTLPTHRPPSSPHSQNQGIPTSKEERLKPVRGFLLLF